MRARRDMAVEAKATEPTCRNSKVVNSLYVIKYNHVVHCDASKPVHD
jgi:hypothetical protein